ncbi:phosphatase PAP2 family protein [Halovivax gelatinilyticus]|uniref:phosphatase PAP2 family protein n=1 Tax=Halovivax gelatinilyticus TaxID=2961597 RepID=UPI0020CA528F|nr:phosphatase PAP2 family protein [Halovivax gelatinilyticus]
MNRDLGVTDAIRSALPDWTIPFFELAAMAGDLLVVGAVIGILVVADVWRSRERADGTILSRRTAFVVGVIGAGLALTLIVKTVIDAPRPPAELQAVGREGNGFPSGHTMAATVLWGALAYWSDAGTQRSRTIVAVALVALVGLSRLALGVHYLVDVLASVAFGLAFLLAARAFLDGDPRRSFSLAVVLGVVALVATGANADGVVAFVGSAGAALGWWVSTQPAVQRVWYATVG